jgi:hypothetical protein
MRRAFSSPAAAPAPAGPQRPPHFDVIADVVNTLGIAALYIPANDFYAHPEIVGRFIADASTIAARVVFREALLTRASSVLRSAGAVQECVFELCGLEAPIAPASTSASSKSNALTAPGRRDSSGC